MSRSLLVDGLVKSFDRVRGSGESLWVSLEAPSGWGKTRVGKEFYARLAARQRPPTYWPETLGGASLVQRKVVVPEFGLREAESLPEFFWWGIACSSDGNSRTDALRLAEGQWEDHWPFVSIACKRDKRLRKKFFEELRTEKWSLAQEGALEAAAQAAAALGAALPGLGLVVWATSAVTKQAKGRKIEKELLAKVAEPGALEGRRVEKLVNNMSQLGKAKFPVVLFVEDVHFADDALLEALGALLRRASHLLVVTTTSPSKIDDSPELSKLARDLAERVLRVGHLAEAGEPFDEGAGLTELDSDACREIVLAHYPHADSETVALLADRYCNPGALDIVCDMDGYKKEFGERGDLYIAPDEIDRLPKVTEDLYRKYWDQLPPSIKLRYAVAAAISPAAINPSEGAGYHTWSAPVLDDVMNRLDPKAVDELSSAIDASTDAYGWVTHVDEYLRRWAELDQHYIANTAGESVLVSQRTTRDRILNNLAKVVLEGASPSAHAARTVIALHAEDFEIEDAQVADAVAVALNDLGHDESAIAERIRLYKHYLDVVKHASIDKETDLEVRFNGIEALAASGRYARAANEYADLHTRASKALGDDDRLTLRSLYKWAVNLQDSGQDDLAIDVFRWACEESRRALGDEDPDTLDARTGLAGALEAEGQNDEAVEILKDVLAARARKSEDHPDTLASRRRLGQALSSMGRSKEAIEMFRRVRDDRAQSLSTNNRDMLNARADLAQASLDTSNRMAITMLESVLGDRVRFLGDDDPDTWDSRDLLAEALWSAGRGNEAVAVFEQVVNDRTSSLGKDHPATLEARYRFAYCLQFTDRRTEIIKTLEQLLADRKRVLGKEHPDTLTTGHSLGVALMVAGQLPEARDMFEQVREGSTRALGGDHPDALATRKRIARVLLETDEVDKAIIQYNELIADSTDVLGEHNVETFELRAMLAEVLMNAGQADEAVKIREQVVQDHIDAFGENHHKTLEARRYLAIMWYMVGRYDKGIPIHEKVIEQEVKRLGNDHPEVWLTRTVLGHSLMEAKQYDYALKLYKRVLDDQIRVLDDENHKNILESRSHIGLALLEAGRAKEAIPDLIDLLADCTKVLGDDNYLTHRVRGYLV